MLLTKILSVILMVASAFFLFRIDKTKIKENYLNRIRISGVISLATYSYLLFGLNSIGRAYMEFFSGFILDLIGIIIIIQSLFSKASWITIRILFGILNSFFLFAILFSWEPSIFVEPKARFDDYLGYGILGITPLTGLILIGLTIKQISALHPKNQSSDERNT